MGEDLRIPPERIAPLLASAEAVFPGCAAAPDPQPRAGLRPAAPTGLPVVGRQRGGPGNPWINSRHGALGFTLAFGTAMQLCEEMAAG